MPLIHSPAKKPFQHNIKSELDAGKPMKQSLAIAYAVKRRAQEKKKMAAGGMVDDQNMGRGYFKPHEGAQMDGHNESLDPMDEPAGLTTTSSLPDEDMSEEHRDAFFAYGGMAGPKALAMKIMAKRKMADGGKVDPNSNMGTAFKSIRSSFGEEPQAKPSRTPKSTESEYELSPEEKAKIKAKRDALDYNQPYSQSTANYAEGGAVPGAVEDHSVPPPGGADEFLSDEEQDPYPEDPREKRRRMISNIMRDLHSSARGK